MTAEHTSAFFCVGVKLGVSP